MREQFTRGAQVVINAQEEHAQGGRGEGGMCRLIK